MHRYIPGFRTYKWWRILPALLFYGFCGLGVGVGVSTHRLEIVLVYVVPVVVMVVVTYLWWGRQAARRQSDAIQRYIPGFRAHSWWRILLALIFYGFCALGIVSATAIGSVGVVLFYAVPVVVMVGITYVWWGRNQLAFIAREHRRPTPADREAAFAQHEAQELAMRKAAEVRQQTAMLQAAEEATAAEARHEVQKRLQAQQEANRIAAEKAAEAGLRADVRRATREAKSAAARRHQEWLDWAAQQVGGSAGRLEAVVQRASSAHASGATPNEVRIAALRAAATYDSIESAKEGVPVYYPPPLPESG